MNDRQFDLDELNIFMKFFFHPTNEEEETNITFLYSNTNGLKHLKNVLNENVIFDGLFNEKEILERMSEKIAKMFTYNNNLKFDSSKWVGKLIINYSIDGYDLNTEFNKWKKQLENLVGKDNIFQVTIPEKQFDDFRGNFENGKPQRERDQVLFNYIESYRLQLELKEDLSINQINERKPKL